MTGGVCVCVPARNEVDRIGVLLASFAAQTGVSPFLVALCVNNTEDNTAAVAKAAAANVGGKFRLEVIERQFAPEDAHAGSARRAAMDLGAELLGNTSGLLISTDADCRAPESWISANLAFAREDRIIGGKIEFDEAEREQAPEIFNLRERFDTYWREVRAIEDRVDPVPWDPAPRHGDHTGASLALSVGLYQRAGGVPLLASGEDRALVEAAVAVGGKLIHPLSVWTRTSARTIGRATGGMACDLQSWIEAISRHESPRVPDLAHWQERARWRRAQRPRMGDALAAAERALPHMPCDLALPAL